MQTSKSEIAELAAQIRAAAIQRRYIEPWLNDRNFVANERGKILYAVDSDIVKLFTDPYSSSATRREQGAKFPGYAEIIPGQEKRVSEALGWILANFIFSKLSNEWPIFVLPPAHYEIERIFNAVAKDAEKETSTALLSIRRLEHWVAEHKNLEIDKLYFENNLNEVLTMIAGGRTYSAEMVRFSRLLNSDSFLLIDQYLLTKRIPDESLRNALSPPTGIFDMIEFGQMIKDWEARVSARSRIRDRQRVQVDARMLARLEWVNLKLSGTNYRMVLITGSHLVFNVCEKYTSNQFSGPLTFADRFIRSPRAYLADPKVVSPIASTDTSERTDQEVGRRLQDWLNTVLGVDDIISSDKVSYRKIIDSWISASDGALKKIAADRLDLNPGLASDIRKKWRAFTKEVSAAATHTETDRLLKLTDNKFSSTHERVAAIRAEFERTLKDSWDEAYKAALGSALTIQKTKRDPVRTLPARNFPLLYLDGHPQTDEAIRAYLRAWQTNNLTLATYEKLRRAPFEDPPHRNYLAFLAQAYVLGITNRWHLSAVTSALAVSVARDYREQNPDDARRYRISGREAAYWRAFSLRSSATTHRDLERAGLALRLAREYASEDVADSGGTLDVKEIRFDAEQLAIDVTAVCLDSFSGEKVQQTPELLDRARRLLDYSSQLVDRVSTKIKLSDPERKRDLLYYEVSFQRIITNFFMLALYLHSRREPDDPSVLTRLHQFQDFIERQKPQPTNNLSYLVLIIYAAATVVFSRDEEQRRKARIEFRELYKDAGKNCTMSYDSMRFVFLADKVTQANK